MASESNFVQAAIPRFDGHYDHWKYRPIVEDGIIAPTKGKALTNAQKTEFEGRKLKDLKAKNYLFQAIEHPILETILCKETSKDIRDSMKKKYQDIAFPVTEYDYVVCSIKESKDIDALSLDELQSSLLVHEQKMNRSSTFEEKALTAYTVISSHSTGRGRGRGRGRGDQENRDGGNKDCNMNFRANDDCDKGRGKDFDKSKVECYRCHKFGHYRSECRTRLPSEKEQKSKFVENNEGETLLMAVHVENELEEQAIWYVDIGCSNHMTGRYVITLRNDSCEIYDPSGGVIAIAKMSRLFPLKIENVQSCFMAEVKDPSWLLHFRYGHLNFGGLNILQKKNMVTGLPKIVVPSQVCEECVVGKQHQSQFTKGKSWKAKEMLELVQSDICGPLTPLS
ncbi:hypothetical protein KY289_003955 [Solanum tuberosum]|nr:hypothetical protein KY284_003769 [Solanum tuberosum]KAH0732767.1 hypothetical protein KY289_003955 [Solanum tuberosum]